MQTFQEYLNCADNHALTVTKKDGQGLVFYISPTGTSGISKILGFRVTGNKVENISDSGESVSATISPSPDQPGLEALNNSSSI